MPWRDPSIWKDLRTLILAFTTAISGGAGGALVASVYTLHRRIDTLALALAHTFVGVSVGFSVFAAAPWIPGIVVVDMRQAMMIGLLAGVAGSVGLAGSHVVVRVVLKRLGIDMELQIRTRDHRGWRDHRRADE